MVEVNRFTQHLDQESIAALELLSRSEIQALMSKWCELKAGGSVLTVSSITIPIEGNQFIVIQNDWADTTKEALDYYFLSARISSIPHDFQLTIRPDGQRYYIDDHSTLNLGASARISRIDVLTEALQESEEAVDYDAGLLITREDGLRIAVIRKLGIIGDLNIAHMEQDIERLLSGLHIRFSFGA